MTNIESPADDLLEGAEAIALFLYGDEKRRRRVYQLAEDRPHHLKPPFFRILGMLCARKSSLKQWLAELENGNAA